MSLQVWSRCLLKTAIILLPLLLAIGCASQPKPSLDNPQYDADGNLIVPPETNATLNFPDTHAGFAYFPETQNVTPIVSVEIIQRPVPYLRDMSLIVGCGSDIIYVGVNKVWTDIFEVQTGILYGRDFSDDSWVIGFDVTIIKF